MGKSASLKNELSPKPRQKGPPARWPFDPMQPGDHEPGQFPEEAQRVQKQAGAGGRNRSHKGARR
jgi:hypothetical protein